MKIEFISTNLQVEAVSKAYDALTNLADIETKYTHKLSTENYAAAKKTAMTRAKADADAQVAAHCELIGLKNEYTLIAMGDFSPKHQRHTEPEAVLCAMAFMDAPETPQPLSIRPGLAVVPVEETFNYLHNGHVDKNQLAKEYNPQK